LIAEPQRPGLSEREDKGVVLKKLPEGMGPEKRLWDMLKERRWERLERFLGREPVRLLKEKSTVCRLSRLAKEEGIGPVRLFFDSILFEQFRHKEIWNVLGFLQTFN